MGIGEAGGKELKRLLLGVGPGVDDEGGEGDGDDAKGTQGRAAMVG